MDRLIIHSNQDLSSLNIRPDVYDPIPNTLTFRVSIGNYRKIVEGDGTRVVSTLKGNYLSHNLVRKGFTAKLDYPEINIGIALRMIAIKALQDKTPIIVHDYIGAEFDNLTQFNLGYTEREGFISLPIEESEMIGIDIATKYYIEGLSFTFKDVELRIS